MSRRYRGGFLNSALPVVTGQQSTPGAWSLTDQIQYQAAGVWPEQLPLTWAVSGTSTSSAPTLRTQVVWRTLQDSSGSSYFLGGTTGETAHLTKFNPDGTLAWSNAYSFNPASFFGAAFFDGVFDSAGNLILVFFNRISANNALGLAKISPSGAVISLTGYDFGGRGIGSAGPAGNCIAIDSADNVYLVGVFDSSSFERRGVVLKVSGSTLNVSWCVGTYGYLGTFQGDFASAVAVTPDQNSVYVSGYAQGASSGTRFGYLSRFAASTGTLLNSYQVTISGQTSFAGGGLAIDSSGSIYLSGRTGSNNYFIGKLNSSVVPQWGFSVATSPDNIQQNLPVSIGSDGNIYFYSWGGNTTGFIASGARASQATLLACVTPAGSLVYTRDTTSYQSVSVPSTGEKVVYLAYANSNGFTQYQRMPADGGGVSLYFNGTGNYYYNYGFGPALTSVTLSVTAATQFSQSLAPSAVTYSGITPGNIPSTYALTTFTSPRIPGSALYALPGTYSWIAPTGVTSVSALAIGGGAGGNGYPSSQGGGGGGLGYINNVAVTPGTAYTVVVGSGGTGGVSPFGNGTSGGTSSFINTSTVAGGGGLAGGGGAGGFTGTGGGTGGGGGSSSGGGGGGGGAGGYAGNGGAGGSGTTTTSRNNGLAGAGGGGAGGFGGNYFSSSFGCGTFQDGFTEGGVGGTVGIAGQGANGTPNGGTGSPSSPLDFGRGGGGGGVSTTYFPCCGGAFTTYTNGSGGINGAVRIVWGAGRSFPSTSVGVP